MPGVLLRVRPDLVSQPDHRLVELLKGGPRQLGTGFGDRATVHGFRLGPQAVAPSLTKERAGFAIYPLAFTAGGEGQKENEQGGQGEFALATKGRGTRGAVRCSETVGN